MTTSSPRVAAHRRTRFPGKTCFLDFMLARLISAKQVVLVYSASRVLLFYQGTVYMRGQASFLYIPTHKRDKSFCAWALVDADSSSQGPTIEVHHRIWPLQASSPQPTRWKGWSKQFQAAMLGMPLWNEKELMEGYVLTAFRHLSTLSFGRRSSLTVLRFAVYLFIRVTTIFKPYWQSPSKKTPTTIRSKLRRRRPSNNPTMIGLELR